MFAPYFSEGYFYYNYIIYINIEASVNKKDIKLVLVASCVQILLCHFIQFLYMNLINLTAYVNVIKVICKYLENKKNVKFLLQLRMFMFLNTHTCK